jgi:hypothetical protein
MRMRHWGADEEPFHLGAFLDLGSPGATFARLAILARLIGDRADALRWARKAYDSNPRAWLDWWLEFAFGLEPASTVEQDAS